MIMVKKNKTSKNVQTKKNEAMQKEQKLKIKKEKTIRRKNYKRINLRDIKENKKILLIFCAVLMAIIYCTYKVIILIQNPTDTFTVEQGKIYQEEATTRIYY